MTIRLTLHSICVNLPACRKFFSNLAVNQVYLTGGSNHGANRFAGGGQFVQNAYFQIAKNCHCQAARDGSGRKIQEVWMRCLAGYQGALLHSKAMLFVHANKAQPGKADILLQQGMGADNDLGFSRADIFLALDFSLVVATFQEDHLQLKAFQQMADGVVMLFGQNFRGSH